MKEVYTYICVYIYIIYIIFMSASEVSLQLSKVFTVATHFKTTPPPASKEKLVQTQASKSHNQRDCSVPSNHNLEHHLNWKKNIFQHVSYFVFFFGNSGYIGELRVGWLVLLSKLDDEVYHLQGR